MLNRKHFITAALVACSIATLNCSALLDPCPGQQQCSDGSCTDVGRVCCGNYESCPADTVCGPANTCIGGGGGAVGSCESCLASGQECCPNVDLTVDCAEVGRVCCGNHTSCPAGTVCSGSECLN